MNRKAQIGSITFSRQESRIEGLKNIGERQKKRNNYMFTGRKKVGSCRLAAKLFSIDQSMSKTD